MRWSPRKEKKCDWQAAVHAEPATRYSLLAQYCQAFSSADARSWRAKTRRGGRRRTASGSGRQANRPKKMGRKSPSTCLGRFDRLPLSFARLTAFAAFPEDLAPGQSAQRGDVLQQRSSKLTSRSLPQTSSTSVPKITFALRTKRPLLWSPCPRDHFKTSALFKQRLVRHVS